MDRKKLCKYLYSELNTQNINSIKDLEDSFKLDINFFKESKKDNEYIINLLNSNKNFDFLSHFNSYTRILNDYICNKYLIGMLYLSPKKTSGIPNVDLCMHSGTCEDFCFDTENKHNDINLRRVRLTNLLVMEETKNSFLNVIAKDILKTLLIAKNKRLIPTIRLNGLSDIPWENKKYEFEIYDNLLKKLKDNKNKFNLEIPEVGEKISLFKLFKNINFYDYTKYKFKKRKEVYLNKEFCNYHLTFSYDKNIKNEVKELLEVHKKNVAFIVKKEVKKEVFDNASQFTKYLILDGDMYDCRIIDDKYYSDFGKVILLDFFMPKNKNFRDEYIINSLSELKNILK